MGSGHLGGDAFERSPGRSSGLGIPRFKLTGTATKPQKNTVLLFLPGNLGKGGGPKKSSPAHR